MAANWPKWRLPTPYPNRAFAWALLAAEVHDAEERATVVKVGLFEEPPGAPAAEELHKEGRPAVCLSMLSCKLLGTVWTAERPAGGSHSTNRSALNTRRQPPHTVPVPVPYRCTRQGVLQYVSLMDRYIDPQGQYFITLEVAQPKCHRFISFKGGVNEHIKCRSTPAPHGPRQRPHTASRSRTTRAAR